MSCEDSKSIESLDYDAVSLTESLESYSGKSKKKKRLGIFHSKKNKEKFDDNLSIDGGTSQLLFRSSFRKFRKNDNFSMSSSDGNSIKTGKRFFKPNGTENNLLTTHNYSASMTDLSNSSSHKKMLFIGTISHILHVRLRGGENLAAKDSNGYSDPYVKFKVNGRTMYKSKCCKETLNPRWDEEFEVPINMNCEVLFRVYDKDFGPRDDFMGDGVLSLTRLKNTYEDITIDLSGSSNPNEDLGCIHFEAKLTSINHEEVKKLKLSHDDSPPEGLSPVSNFSERSIRSCISKDSLRHRSISVNRNRTFATATIQLVSGSDLPARDTNGFSDPYVKMGVGKTKRKSKVCNKTLSPVWKEEFTFGLSSTDSWLLEIGVWDKDSYRKDDFIGRCDLDLSSLSHDETHSLKLNLVDTPGSIHLLITIHSNEESDTQVTRYDLSEIRLRYGASSTFKDLSDIGCAEVRVISASGLRSADINGKSDPFCLINLCNARAQTHTCYRTLDPTWNRVFNFAIHDIHDVFDFWVFDQDQKDEKEFLGRACIPLLRCKNGEKQTYCLKDRKLKNKAKGTITVQISYIFNPIRAAVRTFSPREENYMEEAAKFKKTLLTQNFSRVWGILQHFFTAADFINSCFTWQSKSRSLVAFMMFLLMVWNFELYMVPIVLIMLLMKNYVDIFVRRTRPSRHLMNAEEAQRPGEEEDYEEKEGNNPTLIQRLRALEEILTKVQVVLDNIASLGERVYNTFSWSVPFLGWLLLIVLSIITLVLYLIPLRIIVLLWGINKFTKRLRKPNFIPNNEVLDYLSRVPSNIEIDQYRELQQDTSPSHSKKKR